MGSHRGKLESIWISITMGSIGGVGSTEKVKMKHFILKLEQL
jgi:hypothetical protein